MMFRRGVVVVAIALAALANLTPSEVSAEEPNLRPMGVGEALAYGGFAIVTEPAIYWSSYYLLDRAGVPPFYNLSASLSLSFAPMMGLLAYDMHREEVGWEDFGARMRFRSFGWADAGWAALAIVVGVGASFGLRKLNQQITYPVPSFLDPAMGPYPEGDPATNVRRLNGSSRIKGNWLPPLTITVGNGITVTAEELYWRGLMAPRMELGVGKAAWLLSGSLWALSHGFKYWDILPLFGATLPIAWIGQKTKSTTLTWIVHMGINVITGVAAYYLVAITGIDEQDATTIDSPLERRTQLLDLRIRF